MFEKDLQDKLRRIFRIERVTFDTPSETNEQEGIFIRIDTARNKIHNKKQTAKAQGAIRIYANNEKMPFGYLTKMLEMAAPADKRDIVFTALEENVGTYRNLVERSASFIYFFSGEYNPTVGHLEQVTVDIEVET